ncbi:hypothetical protein HFP89_06285 [Wenzhouxiangella sp. XN79A]|uniref:hypothetical protein n=1 Tax=Wenzhouxiangella sp. XN79A TaxID=2724193 RepID=UPI00144AD3CC|nr:hypothetical protein [Wenzhouxiangella sp. XN79A]NKI34770.1 hypothetical protein [Wenzhouxiangella sp. XN79A]
MRRSIGLFVFILSALLAPAPGAAQFGQFTHVTYQGELEDSGVPVNGEVDLIFSFFDADSGGSLLGTTAILGPVPVVDGRFTVAVPVDPFWLEQPAWMEIEVANPSGAAAFDLLTPRQPVSPAPRALVADSVAPGALFWQSALLRGGALDIIYPGRYVGIGTPGPVAPLNVEDDNDGVAILARQYGSSNGDVAILGEARAGSGGVTGVRGRSLSSPDGTGVLGVALGSSGTTRGVHGIAESSDGIAVHAQHTAGSGSGQALRASIDSAFGYAGFFEGGRNYFEGRIGVGQQVEPNYLLDARGPGAALRAEGTGGSAAFLRLEREGAGQSYIALGNDDAMFFNINATDRMVLSADGDLGLGTQSPDAALDVVRGGSLDIGARVTNSAGGVGFEAVMAGPASIGLRANVPLGIGVFAATASGNAVVAQATAAEATAIEAIATNSSGDSVGVRGTTNSRVGAGVEGLATFEGAGLRGVSQAGGIGVHAIGPVNGLALLADGNVTVNGTLAKSAGSFRIDHPLDPKNRYLSHSFVESPDMMNIYNGNVVTDEKGFAQVELPEWFDALNRDFRYQLTVIGSFARATIGHGIEQGRFVILTDEPNVEVSWQVTGIRDDPYARAHPIPVESDKPAGARGRYQFADWARYADDEPR